MWSRGVLAFVLVSTVASAADQRVLVPADKPAETRIVFTVEELAVAPILWVQADPAQIAVTVTDPRGRRWTQADANLDAAVMVQLADKLSGSSDEVFLWRFLGANATMLNWGKSAPPGAYTVHLSGQGLKVSTAVVLRRSTLAELTADRQEAQRREFDERWASAYPVPEQRTTLDAKGKASSRLKSQRWRKEDVLLVGTSLGKEVPVSVTMPDGTIVNKDNAGQLGCHWNWPTSQGDMAMAFLRIDGTYLGLLCPQRMVEGPIVVTVDTGMPGNAGEMAVAVLRPSSIATAFAGMEKEEPTPNQTVQLLQQGSAERGEEYGVNTIAARPVTIRVAPSGGTDRIASIAVKAEVFGVDLKKGREIMVIGPDPSKLSLGVAAPVAHAPDGSFAYSFLSARPGIFQVDFTAGGLFANGRRFSAMAGVRVFVHPLGAIGANASAPH